MLDGLNLFYTDNGPIYGDIDAFIRHVKMSGLPIITRKWRHDTYEVYNVPCAFDTETTSYTAFDGTKAAWVYIWMFGINGISVYGRTKEEFIYLMQRLHDELGLSFYRRLYCYVHNLPFDFQFIRKWMEWRDVFARSSHSPMYAVCDYGIEFRDSYVLSGKSLEKVGKELTKYVCHKAVGDLDYDQIRGPKTPITFEEMGYCIDDIRVVMCYILELIETEKGKISGIPLTKTGYVRRSVKQNVLKNKRARTLVQSLKISVPEYKMCTRAFQGGFTHANILHSCQTYNNVSSFDETSAYPTVMLLPVYPVSNKEEYVPKSKEDFVDCLKTHCCLFDIEMTDVELRDGMGDAPISASKCWILEDAVKDNGRVRSAKRIVTTIIETDFLVFSKFYTFNFRVGKMYRYRRGYLPRPYIETILQYYKDKTELKGVEERKEDYGRAKADLNSLFGMMCTSIFDDIVFDYVEHGWEPQKNNDNNLEDALEQYNGSRGRFSWFLWALWITGTARLNLFSAIYACGNDYIYSDTDSVKIMNLDTHKTFFEGYNQNITRRLEKTMNHFGFEKESIRPKTIKGEEKPLGIWDYEGTYTRFKTLHSKCYLVEHDDGDIESTVAGISKNSLKTFIQEQEEDAFSIFKDGLNIPEDKTGKLTHTYLDEPMIVEFTDYVGKVDTIETLSGVHLSPAEYKIGTTMDYQILMAILNMGDVSEAAG